MIKVYFTMATVFAYNLDRPPFTLTLFSQLRAHLAGDIGQDVQSHPKNIILEHHIIAHTQNRSPAQY